MSERKEIKRGSKVAVRCPRGFADQVGIVTSIWREEGRDAEETIVAVDVDSRKFHVSPKLLTVIK